MPVLDINELPNYCYEDYKRWEGNWELIYGVPYAMSPAPLIKHQRISNNIAWQLKNLLGRLFNVSGFVACRLED